MKVDVECIGACSCFHVNVMCPMAQMCSPSVKVVLVYLLTVADTFVAILLPMKMLLLYEK